MRLLLVSRKSVSNGIVLENLDQEMKLTVREAEKIQDDIAISRTRLSRRGLPKL